MCIKKFVHRGTFHRTEENPVRHYDLPQVFRDRADVHECIDDIAIADESSTYLKLEHRRRNSTFSKLRRGIQNTSGINHPVKIHLKMNNGSFSKNFIFSESKKNCELIQYISTEKTLLLHHLSINR